MTRASSSKVCEVVLTATPLRNVYGMVSMALHGFLDCFVFESRINCCADSRRGSPAFG